MAVYQFSALSDGQVITFNATADRLNFDQTAIAAGDLTLSTEGSGVRVTVKSGPQAGKDVLLNGFSLEQIAAANFTFADGSFARIGDNNVGTAGDGGANFLSGGVGRDLLMGLGGNDNLQAGDGNDSLVGGTGNDTVSGNNGNDWLNGSAGNDTLNGGGGQDAFILSDMGTANADLLADFSTGWDNVQLDATAFTQIGAAGRFVAGDARFFAGTAAHDADDRIIYNSATREIFYDADGNGAGAAQVLGTLGTGRTLTATDFWVFGTAGGSGNVINGTPGNDTLVGGNGNDTINGLGGDDSLDGWNGADSVTGGDGNDTLSAGPEVDPDTGMEVSDADTLDGGLGNDTYLVHRGTVIAADAGGIDWVHAAITDWTLGAGLENLRLLASPRIESQSGTGNELDNIIDPSGLEHGGGYHGMGGNDTIFTAQRDGVYFGDDGDDVIHGESGNGGADMFGGNGNDTLIGVGEMTGGAGADSFTFLSADVGTIHDFASAVDKIHLDATNMSALGASGNFAAGDARFFAGTTAHDADDRVIFDAATGNLWYDADGNGAGEQGLIAVVTGNVVATDIFIDNGTAGGQTINGTAGNDTLTGGDGNDTINGLAGHDSITGGLGLDQLNGGEGNDTLDGIDSPFLGDQVSDTLDGGLGNDFYVVRESDVILADAGGIDTVQAFNTDWTLGSGLENLDLTDSGIAPSGTGNELDNVIRGGTEGGTLSGLGGNDTLIARNVNNHMSLFGGDGNDTLLGGSTTSNGDELDGGAGDDVLDGDWGPDILTGGTGADHFIIHETSSQDGIDTLTDHTTGVDKIHLDAANMAALGASGNFSVNDARFFAGGAAHDADDRVIWDGSNLWYDADGTGSISQERLAWAFDTVSATDIVVDNGTAGGSTINGTAGDDTLNGTVGPDTINGFGGNDSLRGSDGADSLNGGDGNDTLDAWDFGDGDMAADTLNGGLGNDVYQVHGDGDVILADAGGIDTVRALNAAWTLAADLENLDLEDSRGSSIDGTGNALNNIIRSASEGGTLSGLGGDDLLIARHAQNTVTLLGGDGNDTLEGGSHTNFDGGAGNDVIDGSFLEDNMTGGSGADIFHFDETFGTYDIVMDFASGADKIRFDGTAFTEIGASGNFSAGDARFRAGTAAQDADDRIIFDAAGGGLWYDGDGNGAGEQVLIADVRGTDLVATDITVINGTASGGTINGTPGNDSLVGGAGNDTINGNAGNDTLRGNAGDDSLDGGSGTDLLDGGVGNDFYVVTTGDTLTDAGGNDTVVALNSWALGSGFENLILATSAADGSGNSVSNVIQGNASNNVLRARDGNDTVTGGGGSDFFDFTTAPSTANADTITDFATVDQLRFEDAAFTAIGATGTWGAADGRFWASTAGTAHDANDRVVYNTTTGALYYDADGSGAGAAVLVATLQGAPTVSASDITVI
jgi:Ca2+-binding RTX toxin-like protein